MDHLVYIGERAEELQGLLAGKKTMLVRGAARPKLPYGHVQPDDRLFFVHSDGLVTARSTVSNVFQAERLPQSQLRKLLNTNQSKLKLTPDQIQHWMRKPYLVLMDVRNVQLVEPFHVVPTAFAGDDWLSVEKLETV